MLTTTKELVMQAMQKNRDCLNENNPEILGVRFEQCPEVFAATIFSCSEFFAKHFPYAKGKRLWEVGCGIGIVSVLAALHYGNKVVATDINPQALKMTQNNAKNHGVSDQIDCRLGSLFEPLCVGEKFDYIYWNWPYAYVPEDHQIFDTFENAFMDPGYRMIDNFLAHCSQFLQPDGTLILSFGSLGNRELFEMLIQKQGFRQHTVAEATLSNGRTYWLFQLESLENR